METELFMCSNLDIVPSTSLFSAIRILSSIATYLNTYLDIYPDMTPVKHNEIVLDNPIPEPEINEENISSSEAETDVDNLESIVSNESVDSEPLPTLKQAHFFELIGVLLRIYNSQVALTLPALKTINDISWTLILRIPENQKWKETCLHFLLFAISKIDKLTPSDEKTLNIFLGCMWATGKAIPDDFSLDVQHIENLQKVYCDTTNKEIQVKIIGILCLVGQHDLREMN